MLLEKDGQSNWEKRKELVFLTLDGDLCHTGCNLMNFISNDCLEGMLMHARM
jgi:hypothetical protein